MRDLRPLFDPRSVAVIGASANPAKWGHWLARGALAGADRRAVFLVNRNGGEILGHRAYRSLDELPDAPELVALVVPAASFEESVGASLAVGARALVAITAGLGELGGDGAERERAVVERVRAAGAVLVGPNCLGIFDAGSALRLVSNELPGGSIGLVSQSGNLALELGRLAADSGLGFSRFVSLGNQADVEVAELVGALAAHRPTRLIALYCEDFRNGEAFVAAAADAGKPVLLLAGGSGRAGSLAARSHTGALASGDAAVDAACRAAGILRVRTPSELADTAQALLRCPRPAGRRIAVVADGGGHGIVCADIAEPAGLELPQLSDHLTGGLAESLPPAATTRNPVDLAGGGEQDVWSFARVSRLLLASAEVDGVIVTGYFGGYSEYAPDFAEEEVAVAGALGRAAAESGRPLVVHTMYWDSAGADALREAGVPVYRTTEAAVTSFRRLVEHAEMPAPRRSVSRLPAETTTVAEGYWGARDLLAPSGIPFADARRVRTLDEARAAARELGYPVALKAAALLHKSDAGGVVLGIGREDELERAIEQLSKSGPPDYSLERMAPHDEGVELIVGARRDARFGPILLVGAGGIHAELLRDTAVALAPVDELEAEELLRSLAGFPLLAGARGRPPLDVAAAARAVAALSRVAAARPGIAEIEVNPLLVLPEGVLALDARVVC